MAEALIKGLTAQPRLGNKDIIVSEPREERRSYLEKTYGVKATGSNAEAVKASGIIVLAIKPQIMEEVLNGIAPFVDEEKAVVSIAAGVRLSYLERKLKTKKLVRVMPNTPALVGQGMTVLSLCECMHGEEMSIIRDVFMSVGKVITLPEKYMDAVTALSGSGPAFVALFLEGMIEGAVKMGLKEEDARMLAIETAIGTARLLEEEGLSTTRLREMVTSPGGTTEAGLKAFEAEGLKETVHKAIESATQRAKELGKD